MVTGAASAEAALLLIDANEGVQEQSRRHGYLLHLLGVDQVAVLVNKMDLVGWSADRFGQVAEDYRAYLKGLGVEPVCFVPISAREGDNMLGHSQRMPWYQGQSVVDVLDGFHFKPTVTDRPLRHAGAGRLQVRPAPDHRRPHRVRPARGRRPGDLLAVEQDGPGPQRSRAGTCPSRPSRPEPGRASA